MNWSDTISNKISSWPSKQSKAVVHRSDGDKVSQALVAAGARIDHFRYHRSQFELLATNAVDTDVASSPFEEQQRDTAALIQRERMLHASAHVVAASEALHSACELLCRLAYFSLKVSLTSSLMPKEIGVVSLQRALLGGSRAALSRLADSPEYQYLAALVSALKHCHPISFVPSGGNPKGGLTIDGLEHAVHGQTRIYFESKSANEYLRVECEKVFARLNEFGEAVAVETN